MGQKCDWGPEGSQIPTTKNKGTCNTQTGSKGNFFSLRRSAPVRTCFPYVENADLPVKHNEQLNI